MEHKEDKIVSNSKIVYHRVTQDKKGIFARDLLLPILVWAGMIFTFTNLKDLPFEFSDKDAVVFRFLAKVVVTVLFPLALIYAFYRDKSDFGIYFPRFKDSLKLTVRAYSVAGPACMAFLVIAALGWKFDDWEGAAVLGGAFLAALYFIPRVTGALPSRMAVETPNRNIWIVVLLSFATLIVAYFGYGKISVFPKLLYYVFIVGLGEELFFRGYIQSAANRFFGKSFRIGNVHFGWGLIFAAALFGLAHALMTQPPAWPWAVWTIIMGLILGFVREKDGSILAAVMLHALLDAPLAFMG